MDRRNFMRSILGVAAATALPSEVWPFRKIFIPTVSRFDLLDMQYWGLSRLPYPGPLSEAAVSAVELEAFAKQIPNLLSSSSTIYNFFKKDHLIIGELETTYRIPMRRVGGFTLVMD